MARSYAITSQSPVNCPRMAQPRGATPGSPPLIRPRRPAFRPPSSWLPSANRGLMAP